MSINSIPTFIGSLAVLLIGLFVYFKNPKASVNFAFGLFCFSLFGWLFGYTIVYSATGSELAMMGTRIACAFAAFTAPAFYHLVISYLEKENEKRLVNLSYLLTSVFFFLFIFTNYLLATPYKYSWGYYSHANTFHPIYLAVFFGVFLRGFYLLYRAYQNRRKLSPAEATRIAYIFLAYSVALLGAVDYFQKYGVDFYPLGWVFEVGFAFIMAYAILRHRLMDIEIVIKRTAVYSILTAFLTGIFASLILIGEYVFRGLMGYSSLWPVIIGAFIVAVIFQPLREGIQFVVDSIFFRARYDYQRILAKYSYALTQPMADLNRFAHLAPYLLTKAMKISSASVMVLNRDEHRYDVRAGEREAEELVGSFIDQDSVLINELMAKRREVTLGEITDMLKTRDISAEERKRLESMADIMTHLKSVAVIPSISESEYFGKPVLLSALCIGEKLSGESFSREDIEFLRTLANQATISIEYAFIFEELKRHQDAVVRSEKLATIGTTTAGIAHELKNPLTYLSTVAQVLPMKWDDLEFRKTVTEILPSEMQRMQLIIEGLLDYSRERELMLKSTDVKQVIEKTCMLLSFNIRKMNIMA